MGSASLKIVRGRRVLCQRARIFGCEKIRMRFSNTAYASESVAITHGLVLALMRAISLTCCLICFSRCCACRQPGQLNSTASLRHNGIIFEHHRRSNGFPWGDEYWFRPSPRLGAGNASGSSRRRSGVFRCVGIDTADPCRIYAAHQMGQGNGSAPPCVSAFVA